MAESPARPGKALCLFVFFLLLAFVMAVASSFVPVVTSLTWFVRTFYIGAATSLVFAALWGVMVFLLPTPDLSLPRRIAAWMVGLLMGALTGWLLVNRTIPGVAALAFGQQVGNLHVVDSLPRYERKCSNPILLLGIEKLCGYPEELRAKMAPGMRIVVIGRGTWMGVIPREVEPLDLAKLSRRRGRPAPAAR